MESCIVSLYKIGFCRSYFITDMDIASDGIGLLTNSQWLENLKACGILVMDVHVQVLHVWRKTSIYVHFKGRYKNIMFVWKKEWENDISLWCWNIKTNKTIQRVEMSLHMWWVQASYITFNIGDPAYSRNKMDTSYLPVTLLFFWKWYDDECKFFIISFLSIIM